MAGVGRTSNRVSNGDHDITDPRKKLASTANTEKRTHTMKTSTGSTVDIKTKTVKDAKAGRGAFEAPKNYKGEVIKNKDGKMSGYKTHDGKYTRTTDPVSRKAGEKVLAYDRKVQESQASKKADRNKRFAEAKVKGTK